MTDIDSLPTERQMALVQQCPALFRQIANPSPEVRMAYVLASPVEALRDIPDPTDLEQFAGIIRSPDAAFYLKSPGPLAQFLLAMGRDWDRRTPPPASPTPTPSGPPPGPTPTEGRLASWVISPQGTKALAWLVVALLLLLYFYF